MPPVVQPFGPHLPKNVCERLFVKSRLRLTHRATEVDDPLARGTTRNVHSIDPGLQHVGVRPAVRVERQKQPAPRQSSIDIERAALGISHKYDVSVLHNPSGASEIDARLANPSGQIGMDFQDWRAIQCDSGCYGIVALRDADKRDPYGGTIEHPPFIIPCIKDHALRRKPLKNLPVGSATNRVGTYQACARMLAYLYQAAGLV